MLEKDSFQLVDDLFDAVLDLEPEERLAYLDRNSPSAEVREQVVKLLESLESAEMAPGGAISGAFGEHLRREIEGDSSITPGTSLGDYRIEGLLGAGGMGEVYRARDTKLHRDVAIKVLPVDMVAPEQLERFDREARALAAVNYPHIGAIYGLEREEGRPYLVLELVPGMTLAERLDNRALPLRRAIAVAIQIAGALEAAHAAGIVHRDLKPANIKISDDSQVKVLDFGLAKTEFHDRLSADDETVAAPTRTGVILGTAGYMSPEQARGAAVDRRTDNWAFGCVLFEMLTGRRLFRGKTPSDTLAAVLREEPPWEELPAATPEMVRRLLRRCLTKDAQRRLQHIGDARLELEDWLDHGEVASVAPRRFAWQSWLGWAAAVLGLALSTWLWSTRAPDSSRPRTAALQLLPTPGTEFWSHYSPVVSISPDGSRVAYIATGSAGVQELYLRSIDALEAVRVEGSVGAISPFFSPDGEWVGFFSDLELKKVPATGGVVLSIAEVGGNSRGAAWADGFIVFAQSQTTALKRVDEDGGAVEPLTELDEQRVERSHRWPQMIGDKAVLFTSQTVGSFFDDASLVVQDLESGVRTTLVSRAGYGRLLPNDQLAYVRSGRLYVVAVDTATWTLKGDPRLVLEGVAYDPRNGGAQFSVAQNGTLVFRPGAPVVEKSEPVSIDARGNVSHFGGEARVYNSARWSPDSERLAASVMSAQGEDVWLIQSGSNSMVRATYGGASRPVWSPDAKWLAYASGSPGSLDVFVTEVDGGAPGEILITGDIIQLPVSWSPDGRFLLFQQRDPESGWDLLMQEVEVSNTSVRPVGEPRCLRCTLFNEAEARLSPDGRLIAYESDELDSVYEIYVQQFPAMGRKWQLSAGGARRPVFGPTDNRIYYWTTESQGLEGHRLSFDGSVLSIGETETFLVRGVDLWESGTRGDPGSSGFGVSGDGKFLMLRPQEVEPAKPVRQSDVVIVLDWVASLTGDG